MAQKGWGRSEGLSAGELTGMYCTAAWPVPLSSHWPSSLRQYTFARWRASTPLSPMLAHPAQGPGARAAAAVSHRACKASAGLRCGPSLRTRWRLDGGAKTDRAPATASQSGTHALSDPIVITLAINSFRISRFAASPRGRDVLSPVFGQPRRVALFWYRSLSNLVSMQLLYLPLLVLFVDVVLVVPFFIAQELLDRHLIPGFCKVLACREFFLTRTDFINKKVYPKEGTRVRIPGTHCIRTQCEAVGH